MTLRTVSALRCRCGHTGSMRTAENDQPYSASWTRHELDGFSGTVSEWKLDFVRCPSCGQIGKVSYADDD